MTEILATRAARRRAVLFVSLLAASLLMMALSSAPIVRELQRGVGFAFRPFQAAVDSVAGSVAELAAAVEEIEQLRRDNEALAAENEELRNLNDRLEATKRENDQLTALLQLRSGLDFATVAAQVIARESSEFQRVMTIDRGTDDRLALGDVVVAAGGALAGRIVEIGPNSATVLLINDASSTVIGQLAATGTTGEVIGQLGGVLVMQNVDATVDVVPGDEALTAGIVLEGGARSPYPKGLLLGEVVDVKRSPNAVVQTVYLRSAADLDRLEYVLVITDYEGGLPLPSASPAPGEPSASPDASSEPGTSAEPSPSALPSPAPTELIP
jgi:rod shape-determining protein MreC